jgi:hypothetical protein
MPKPAWNGLASALVLLLSSALLAAAEPAQGAKPPSFINDVLPVLTRLGCNQGACHGKAAGQNGFRLSLRGFAPDLDYDWITREHDGRRIDPAAPERSLLLLKPLAIAPHEGGKVLQAGSREYQTLLRWLQAGAPGPLANEPQVRRLEVAPGNSLCKVGEEIQLVVRAQYTDGQWKDVTWLTRFEANDIGMIDVTPAGNAKVLRRGESAVRATFEGKVVAVFLTVPHDKAVPEERFAQRSNFIDDLVFAKLKMLRTEPSELCSDSVFGRRAYLDLLGLVPNADETRRFLADGRADKRARLIDELLQRPEFADFWALKWSDVLRNEEKTLDKKGVQAFHHWIRQAIAEGRPLNEFARDIVTARGSTYSEPAANFYRALREPQVRAEAFAQVFLGVRIQCARCHNHPFDVWSQNDYHSLAAFFARIDYRILENNRKDRLDTHEFDGEQIVFVTREGETKHPRTGEVMQPRLLATATPRLADDADRLQLLANWIAKPDNPFFARTQVNRVWYHLLGRGIVDPNDDFRASNPPANGPLLGALTKDFVTHRFDLRHLIRTIMTSRTYQLSAVPTESNKDDETNFARAVVRPLQAEQLLDSFSQVVGVPAKFNGYPLGTRAAQLPGAQATRHRGEGPTDAEKFLKVFGKPERLLSCECERSDDTTLSQAFQLLTGELMNTMLAEKDNRIGQLLDAGKSNRQIVEEFYLSALSRPPSEKEMTAALKVVERSKDRRAGLEDLVWGLVNAKEFLLRR